MAGSLLSQLFVEISAKGLKQASDEIRGMQKSMHAAQGMASAFSSGVMALATPLKYMAGIAGGVAASFTALAYKGFEGTTQMYLFTRQSTLLGREIAAILMPILDLMTRVLSRVVDYFRNLSATGQRVWLILILVATGASALVGAGIAVIAVITGIIAGLIGLAAAIIFIMAEIDTATGGLYTGVLIIGAAVTAITGLFTAVAGGGAVGASTFAAFAVSSEKVRAAFAGVADAFMRLFSAAEPMLTRLLYLFVLIIEIGMNPMIAALTTIEVMLILIERVANRLANNPFLSKLGKYADKQLGIGSDQSRNTVTPNKTGTESAESKYDRIQEEIYRITSGDKGSPEERTATAAENIFAWIKGQEQVSGQANGSPDVRSVISGAVYNLSPLAKILGSI